MWGSLRLDPINKHINYDTCKKNKISHELNYPYEQIYNMLVHVHTLYKYSPNYIIYTYNHAPIRTHVTVM